MIGQALEVNAGPSIPPPFVILMMLGIFVAVIWIATALTKTVSYTHLTLPTKRIV